MEAKPAFRSHPRHYRNLPRYSYSSRNVSTSWICTAEVLPDKPHQSTIQLSR